ncbi:MAG: threonine/serine dehydratase [Synergistaceae bacterium]|jgi:threonine dehydratase|nr:threonine/serine dehydratase [Synergistaceae bacterium]
MVALKDIYEARERISPFIHRTTPERSATLSKMSGFDVWLKPECRQRTGSFKIRGALNRILSLSPEEGKRGIVTGSSGNHGQAVACAAQLKGYSASIIMPEDASSAKIAAVKGYGAQVIFRGTRSDERLELAHKMRDEQGMTLVHPYDDPYVMAGQGTVGLEILEDIDNVAAVLVPTGGGGLISGIATAVKELNPKVKVFGVEPTGSDSTGRSFRAGKRTRLDVIDTIADGIRTTIPGELTFPVVQKYVDDMLLVTEEAIAEALRLILERCKILAEPTGTVTTAAVLTPGVLPDSLKGKRVVPLVSGGNIALSQLADLIIQS